MPEVKIAPGKSNQTSKSKPPQTKPSHGETAVRSVWKVVRAILVFVTSLVLVVGVVYQGWQFVYNRYFAPSDASDNTPVMVSISRGSSINTVASALYEAGVVRNKGIFKYYVELTDRGADLKAGNYQLSRGMTMDEIISELTSGEASSNVTTFLVTEGQNVEAMAQSLVRQGVLKNTDEFLALCKNPETFREDYDFIDTLMNEDTSQRKYILEGYLFPAKYEIYLDSTAEDIIRRMLDKTDSVLTDIYRSRAEELDMSVDEVLTLASLIEKESKTADFKKVSAVFHNRLKRDMNLESCVTVQYILNTHRLNLTNEDISVDSPYNTYKNKGLPEGPIANPGQAAIEAALYPDEDFRSEGYLFFCVKEPTSGELYFSKTAAEHQRATEEFRPLWEQYDQSQGN